MEKVFIVFKTTQHSNANEIRETLLVTVSLESARRCILDDIVSEGNNGMLPDKYYDFIDDEPVASAAIIDEENTSHNGLVLKAVKPFMSIEFNDSPDPSDWNQPSEWRMRWEIEEQSVSNH